MQQIVVQGQRFEAERAEAGDPCHLPSKRQCNCVMRENQRCREQAKRSDPGGEIVVSAKNPTRRHQRIRIERASRARID